MPSFTSLKDVQATISLNYGSLDDELPEQEMAFLTIQPTDTVLEIGGNIGRNSLVISKLLDDSSRLTVLECSKDIFNKLEENRNLNNEKFQTLNVALSAHRLIQKGWNTIPWEQDLPIPEDFTDVKTITFEEILQKSKRPFTTLVADCEGALFYILQDFPSFFSHFQKIIVENDYFDIKHKIAVDNELERLGFQVIYEKEGGWGICQEFFYQVWAR
jgi:FkbM family methyltransferase